MGIGGIGNNNGGLFGLGNPAGTSATGMPGDSATIGNEFVPTGPALLDSLREEARAAGIISPGASPGASEYIDLSTMQGFEAFFSLPSVKDGSVLELIQYFASPFDVVPFKLSLETADMLGGFYGKASLEAETPALKDQVGYLAQQFVQKANAMGVASPGLVGLVSGQYAKPDPVVTDGFGAQPAPAAIPTAKVTADEQSAYVKAQAAGQGTLFDVTDMDTAAAASPAPSALAKKFGAAGASAPAAIEAPKPTRAALAKEFRSLADGVKDLSKGTPKEFRGRLNHVSKALDAVANQLKTHHGKKADLAARADTALADFRAATVDYAKQLPPEKAAAFSNVASQLEASMAASRLGILPQAAPAKFEAAAGAQEGFSRAGLSGQIENTRNFASAAQANAPASLSARYGAVIADCDQLLGQLKGKTGSSEQIAAKADAMFGNFNAVTREYLQAVPSEGVEAAVAAKRSATASQSAPSGVAAVLARAGGRMDAGLMREFVAAAGPGLSDAIDATFLSQPGTGPRITHEAAEVLLSAMDDAPLSMEAATRSMAQMQAIAQEAQAGRLIAPAAAAPVEAVPASDFQVTSSVRQWQDLLKRMTTAESTAAAQAGNANAPNVAATRRYDNEYLARAIGQVSTPAGGRNAVLNGLLSNASFAQAFGRIGYTVSGADMHAMLAAVGTENFGKFVGGAVFGAGGFGNRLSPEAARIFIEAMDKAAGGTVLENVPASVRNGKSVWQGPASVAQTGPQFMQDPAIALGLAQVPSGASGIDGRAMALLLSASMGNIGNLVGSMLGMGGMFGMGGMGGYGGLFGTSPVLNSLGIGSGYAGMANDSYGPVGNAAFLGSLGIGTGGYTPMMSPAAQMATASSCWYPGAWDGGSSWNLGMGLNGMWNSLPYTWGNNPAMMW